MLLLGVVFFSMWYFLSLYLQEVHGYGPLKAGLLFLPMSAAIIIGAQVAGRVLAKVGPRRLLFVGLVLSTAGFAWISQVTAGDSFVKGLLGGTLLIALGTGLSFAPLATAATTGVHWSQAGLASGVLNTSRQVGGSIGLAALATVATDRTAHFLTSGSHGHGTQILAAVDGHISPFYADGLTAGYDRAFLIAAFTAGVAAVCTLLVPEQARTSNVIERDAAEMVVPVAE
jgi:MFS family permease